MIEPTSPQAPRLRGFIQQPVGQVKIELDDRPLFVERDDVEFLGDAAKTIGGGARWRHPFPQDWAWPPSEPASVTSAAPHFARVDEPEFTGEYGCRPEVEIAQSGSELALTARLENLEGEAKQAWIVAPFSMPSGHQSDAPKALAVFPASPAELAAIPDAPGEGARWAEDAERGLVFINPGGEMAEGQQDKLLMPDRWSAFAREGDSAILLMPPTGSRDPEAFQAYAGFDSYVELEWAGDPAEAGRSSQVTTRFQAVPLAGLALGEHAFGRFGESGRGLREELASVIEALDLPGKDR